MGVERYGQMKLLFSFNRELVLFYNNKAVEKSRPIPFEIAGLVFGSFTF